MTEVTRSTNAMTKPICASLILLFSSIALLAGRAEAQEDDLDILLDQLDPAERFARRVTPESLVANRANPSVVFIETEHAKRVRTWPFGDTRTQIWQGSGTGVVIREEGFIVTNYHVVKAAQRVAVSFDPKVDSRRYDADLISYVEQEDLALLRIRGADGQRFPTVEMGTSSDLMIGERVVAIGNPHGQTHTVSVGIVSGLHRNVPVGSPDGTRLQFDDLIQTDASINQGNSGGPLLNINGELIGVNCAVNKQAENIGFAIPIDRVRQVLEDQLVSPERYRAWLGFQIDEKDQLEVETVFAGGPAADAGLKPGDRILAIAGREVRDAEAYHFERLSLRPDRPIPLRVRRGGSERSMTLNALDKASGLLLERMGIEVVEVVRGPYTRFLSVSQVLEGSPAQAVGLRTGDVINAVRPDGDRARRTPRKVDLAHAIASMNGHGQLEIDIEREGKLYEGTLVLHPSGDRAH